MNLNEYIKQTEEEFDKGVVIKEYISSQNEILDLAKDIRLQTLKEAIDVVEEMKQKGRHKGDCLCKTCHMIEGYNQALFEAIQIIKKQDES